MVTTTTNGKAELSDDAEVRHEYDPDGEFAIDDGNALRLEGLHRQGNLEYVTRINGIPLRISTDGITVDSDISHTINSALVVKQTTVQEAFAYLHGEYTIVIENQCLGCSATYTNHEPKPCSCPVGGITHDVTYPDVEPRKPRCAINGKAYTRAVSEPSDST